MRSRARWVAVVVGVVATALAGGLAFGLLDSNGIQAQTAGHPQGTILDPAMVVTPVTRIPEMDTSQNPITVKVVEGRVIKPKSANSVTRTMAGSVTEPEGRYLHLPRIGRYYSLPDDVALKDTYHFYSCPLDPSIRCPVTPLYVYQRGEAEIGIDSMGEIFTNWAEADASAFPFFTGHSN